MVLLSSIWLMSIPFKLNPLGRDNVFPTDYTPLYFLQAVQGGKNNPLSYINVPTNVNSFEDDFEFSTCHEVPTTALSAGAQYQEGVNVSHWSIQWIWANSNWRMFTTMETFDTGLTNLGPVVLRCKRKSETNTMVATVGHMMRELPMSSDCLDIPFNVNPMGVFWTANNPKMDNGFVHNSYVALGKKWWWKFYINGKLQNDLRPALDASGTPCMYDLVNSTPFYNVGRVPFVAGVETIQHLRRVLDNLPTTGGTLSLSLPAKANTPEIADMLAAASAEKGWTLTVYEYRTTAATTYSLRRVRQVVWCRKQAAEYGCYEDAAGNRWQLERCAAIFGDKGDNPADYGYEPFDSEEQAAEEWRLEIF